MSRFLRFDRITTTSIVSLPLLLFIIWSRGNFTLLLTLVSCNCFFWSHLYHASFEQSTTFHHLDMASSMMCYFTHLVCCSLRNGFVTVLSNPLLLSLQTLSCFSFFKACGRHENKNRSKNYIYHHSNFHIFAGLLGICFVLF